MLTWHALECCRHLGNEKRFAILCALVEAEADGLSLSQLSHRVKVSRGVIRRHMQQMDTSGLVRMERDGRRVVCTVNTRRINDLLAFLGRNLGGPDLMVASDGQAAGDETEAPALFSSLRDRLSAFDDAPATAARRGSNSSLTDALSEASGTSQFDRIDGGLKRRKRADVR